MPPPSILYSITPIFRVTARIWLQANFVFRDTSIQRTYPLQDLRFLDLGSRLALALFNEWKFPFDDRLIFTLICSFHFNRYLYQLLPLLLKKWSAFLLRVSKPSPPPRPHNKERDTKSLTARTEKPKPARNFSFTTNFNWRWQVEDTRDRPGLLNCFLRGTPPIDFKVPTCGVRTT